ncbi:MAG: SUMF1/EgtB/PvdO family nonheme iron enzyme, partial [Myxococcales bacterium]|nr:SUMF1/EgtB/PvdO family nonheme iron enzyme [Myxococcales bacterium]
DSWASQSNGNVDWPVSRVDWCDAWAYCTWSGGHICGLVGGAPEQMNDYNNATTNEWYRACTDGGTLLYPYGNSYDPNACNGMDAALGTKAEVGSLAGCEGGVAGLFDMSGNVFEWTSACAEADNTPDETEECRYRGGSYFSPSNTLRCSVNATRPRNYRNTNTGIRCCYP